MLVTQVALVPLEAHADPASDIELLWVASALQTQITRDFGPTWDVHAVVTPFLSLMDVPPQYVPVVLTTKPLPRGEHGFHLGADGRAFALVYRGERWSVTASHELMEMVLDPSGTLTVSAPSLADEYTGNGPSGSKSRVGDLPGYAVQGMVDYLVEPCDPVERATSYAIDGVEVSDFVTPDYYDAYSARGVRYSFLGNLTHPLEICDGGYLSWRTYNPPNSVWQAHAAAPDGGDSGQTSQADSVTVCGTLGSHLTIGRLKDDSAGSRSPAGKPDDDFVSRFSRDQVAVRTRKRGTAPRPNASAPGAGGHASAPAAGAHASAPPPLRNPYAACWEKYGERFAADLGEVVGFLAGPPPPTLRDVINLLKELEDLQAAAAKAGGGAAAGPPQPPPQHLLDKYNIKSGKPPALGGGALADPAAIIALLEKQERVTNILDSNAADPDMARWLCYLMP